MVTFLPGKPSTLPVIEEFAAYPAAHQPKNAQVFVKNTKSDTSDKKKKN